MARRRRSFFFDNINKKLVMDTFKTVSDVKDDIDSAAVANNTILTLEEIQSEISSTLSSDNYATQTYVNSTVSTSNTAMKTYVDNEVAGIVDSAPGTLNTLNELAAALGDDANYATTTSTALGNRLRIDVNNQSLTGTQKTNALTNLGITATVAELNYIDGVTSNIQTQLNSLGSVSNLGDLSVTASPAEINILDGATLTTTELNYVDGVTSSIQTQLNSKIGSTYNGNMTAYGYIETKVAAASGTGTKTFNLNSGSSFEYTGTGAGFTAAFSNVPGTNTISWTLKTTNSGTITWPAGVNWSEGVTPPPSSGTDIYSFISIAGTIYGSLAMRNAS